MESLNTNELGLAAGNNLPPIERIATLEERSQHAATKSELHRALLWLYIAILTTFGGLMLHLHNTTLNEISDIRQLLIELAQRLPGG